MKNSKRQASFNEQFQVNFTKALDRYYKQAISNEIKLGDWTKKHKRLHCKVK